MYKYRKLRINDINQMIDCRDLVVSDLKNKSNFIKPSNEFLRKILSGYGVSIGVFDNENLIGFASLSYPDNPIVSIGEKIGYEFATTTQLEHYLVLPQYRKRGIANNLCNILLNYNKKEYIVCLIAPNNIPSLSLCFKQKFRIIKLIKLKNDYQRYILFKNLTDETTMKNIFNKKIFKVPNNNISKINKMLNNGYIGFAFDENKRNMLLYRN